MASIETPQNGAPTSYVISTKINAEPEIFGFNSFDKAECKYYTLFAQNTTNANIVLLNMPNATYDQLAIAYSNYLLVGHDFMHYFNELTREMFDISSGISTSQLKPYFNYYHRALRCYNDYIHFEQKLLRAVYNLPQNIQQEWHDDVRKRYKELFEDNKKFQQELYHRFLYDQKHTKLGKLFLKLRLKLFR